MHGAGQQHTDVQLEEVTTMIEYLVTWLQLKTDRRAVTALEYGVIAGVMAVVLVTAFTTLGTKLTGVFNTIGSEL
jgi:pilus assembly protein Flp/PilA